MSEIQAVLVDIAMWAAWGGAVGFVAARCPASRFASDGPITRIRGWERDGRVWEPTGIRRWKGRVPELGGLSGGVSKRRMTTLDRLAVETRRAELVHWAALAPIVVIALFNPAWLTAVMAVYAVAANVPCILIQRYNRARVLRIRRASPCQVGMGPI